MPAASKIKEIEKEDLMNNIAHLVATNPRLTQRDIGKQVGRDHTSVSKIMSDKKFSKYTAIYKKKIDAIRVQAIEKADAKVLSEIDNIKPYQLIGLSKTYYEQVFNLNSPVVAIQNNQAIQVVEGVTK